MGRGLGPIIRGLGAAEALRAGGGGRGEGGGEREARRDDGAGGASKIASINTQLPYRRMDKVGRGWPGDGGGGGRLGRGAEAAGG